MLLKQDTFSWLFSEKFHKRWLGSCSQNQEKSRKAIYWRFLFVLSSSTFDLSFIREYQRELLFNIKYFSHFVHVLWLWYNQCWSSTLLKAWDQMSCTYVLKLFDSVSLISQKYWCLGYTDQSIAFRPPVPGRQHNS